MPISFSDPVIRVELQNLIATGKTAEALLMLFEAGIQDSISLKAQLDAANDDFEHKKIGYEAWTIIRNNLNYSILQLVDQSAGFMPDQSEIPRNDQAPVPETTPLGPVPHAAVKALIVLHKTEAALRLCRNLGNAYILQNARFLQLQKHFNLGLISNEVLENTLLQINTAILAMIEDAPDGPLEEKLSDAQETQQPDAATKHGFWYKIRNMFR